MEIGKNFTTDLIDPDTNQFIMRETKLCCTKIVNQESYSMVKWVDSAYDNWSDPQCTKFVLQPIDECSDKFYIEMPYGNVRPRLASYSDSVTIQSNVISSTKQNITDTQTVWTISPAVL